MPKETGKDVLLASLPSSVDHLPRSIVQKHGCHEIPEGNICCYIFKAGMVITDNAWSFPLDTYLYGEWLDEYELGMLKDIYPVEDIDYEIKGRRSVAEFAALIRCFAHGATVKRKYKRLLAD